jgi:hypothetical protein
VDVIFRDDYDMYCEVFINDVCMAGMLGFNFNPKDTVEFFVFVGKKNGVLRMVADAHVPNRRFQNSPPQQMGTSAAWSRLQFGSHKLENGRCARVLYSASADIRNYLLHVTPASGPCVVFLHEADSMCATAQVGSLPYRLP